MNEYQQQQHQPKTPPILQNQYEQLIHNYGQCDRGFFIMSWHISTAVIYAEVFILLLLLWKPSKKTIHIFIGLFINVYIFLVLFSFFNYEYQCILTSSLEKEKQPINTVDDNNQAINTAPTPKIYKNVSGFPAFDIQTIGFLLITLYKHQYFHFNFLKKKRELTSSSSSFLYYYRLIILFIITLIILTSYLWTHALWQILLSLFTGVIIGIIWSIDKIRLNRIFNTDIIGVSMKTNENII